MGFLTHSPKSGKPRSISWAIFSRPFGTALNVHVYPGLRPGLGSGVPVRQAQGRLFGTRFQAPTLPTERREPLLQVHPCHGAPPGPIVEAAIAPDVELVPDALVAQDGSKLLVLFPAEVPLAGGQHGADMVVLPRIGAVGEIVGRVVEVQVFAIPAVDEVLHIEGSAHGNDAGDHFGMAEAEVRGMVGAEAATGGDQSRRLVLLTHQGQHIAYDVALILHMPLHPPIGVGMFVVPTLLVNAVDAIELQLAAIDAISHACDHAIVFILKESTPRSGEDEHLGSCVAKAQQFHVAAQIV